MQRIKCYNCYQKGHLAKKCTLPRKFSKRVTVQSDASLLDTWYRGVFVMDATSGKCQMFSKAPGYKVDIILIYKWFIGPWCPSDIGEARIAAKSMKKLG